MFGDCLEKMMHFEDKRSVPSKAVVHVQCSAHQTDGAETPAAQNVLDSLGAHRAYKSACRW